MSSLKNFFFKAYRDKYIGCSCVLLAPGPTLCNFDKNMVPPDTMYCAVNSAIENENTLSDLDFYFFGDRHMPEVGRYHMYLDKIKHLPKKTVKFAKIYRENKPLPTQVSVDFAKRLGAHAYEDTVIDADRFRKDIAKECLSCHCIVFQALQFLLFAGFKTIYLVGCDCGTSATTGHAYFKKEIPHNQRYNTPKNINKLLNLWKCLKLHVNSQYPNTQVMVINSKGLKGIFPDYN